MVIIIGFIIIMGGTLGGFILAEGQIKDLIHKAEIVTILGMLFGCAIIMAPVSVLQGISSGLMNILKGKYRVPLQPLGQPGAGTE